MNLSLVPSVEEQEYPLHPDFNVGCGCCCRGRQNTRPTITLSGHSHGFSGPKMVPTLSRGGQGAKRPCPRQRSESYFSLLQRFFFRITKAVSRIKREDLLHSPSPLILWHFED